MKSKEKISHRVGTAKTRVAVFSGLILATTAIKDHEGVRNHLPEPFDIPDHIGNTNISFMIGGLAAIGYSYCVNLSDTDSNVIRSKLVKVGLATGVLINAYVETKFGVGINPIYHNSTPDLTDFSYGVVGGGLGALIMPTIADRQPTNTGEVT